MQIVPTLFTFMGTILEKKLNTSHVSMEYITFLRFWMIIREVFE